MEVSMNCALIVGVSTIMCLMMANIEAYTFYAGGKDGWVPNPSVSYGVWAAQNRFQINDTVVFKYNKGENSVLVVTKPDYDACNVNNPLQKLDEGNSAFQFPASGPFYFISGNKDYCNQGQKLAVVVLAARGGTQIPAKPPTTGSQTPTTPAGEPTVAPGSAAADVGVVPVPAPETKHSAANVASLSKVCVGLVVVMFVCALV